jgi:hypothetical protein
MREKSRTPVTDVLHDGQFHIGEKLLRQGEISVVDVRGGTTLDEQGGSIEYPTIVFRVGEVSNVGDAPRDNVDRDPERIVVFTRLLDQIGEQKLLHGYVLVSPFNLPKPSLYG